MTTSQPTVTLPKLPTWSDAQSVATYLTSLIGMAVAAIGLFHPGFTEPALVTSLVPIAGTIVAGAAQAVNVVSHRSTHAAAFVAANTVVAVPAGGSVGAPSTAPVPANPVTPTAADQIAQAQALINAASAQVSAAHTAG